MPEITWENIFREFLTFSFNKGVSGKLENRFSAIPGRNIKIMIFRRWKSTVPFVSPFSSKDSMRAAIVEPRFAGLRARESVWNVFLHTEDYHLCYVFSTQRWVFTTEAIVIPWEIRLVLPQVIPPSRCKMPKAHLLWRVLRLY